MRETNDRHPRFRALLDRREGLLSPRRATEVDSHLAAGCDHCGTEVAAIGELLAALGAGPLPAPPASVAKHAARLFIKRRARGALERIRAALIFDERLQPAMALRSAVGTARRLLFGAGELEVYLELVRAAEGWTLMGEFLPADDDGSTLDGVVFVRMGERVVGRADLDVDGTFTLEGLPDGVIGVEGRVAGRWIDVPPIATG